MLQPSIQRRAVFGYVVFLSMFTLNEAVALSLVRIACERNPKLSFCDSHILGDPITSTTKPVTTTTPLSNMLDTGKMLPGYTTEEHQQLVTWMTDQKDEVPDSELDTEELEGSHRGPGDIGEYCTKYKTNFEHYCQNSTVEKLEGVLPHFCSVYGRHCGIDDFPTPIPLLHKIDDKHVTENYCEKFSKQYKQLCRVGSKYAKTDEFCASYRASCTKGDSAPASRTAVKEIENIEDPPDNAAGAGAQLPDEEEENETSVSPRTARYCEKFWENFNYFCAGGSSTEHEKFCRSYRKNCPQKVGSLKTSPSFLGGKEKTEGFTPEDDDDGGNGGDGGGGGGRASLYLYKGTKEGYCDKFGVNYEFYCKGDSTNPEITAKFCPSYKKACRDGSGPANPFTRSVSTASTPENARKTVDAGFPDIDNPGTSPKRRRGRGRGRGRKRVAWKAPCTADCDVRIHRHCTASCKCDFAYPFVQKFCNPPPLPFFLNTCRLWYAGCPKYEQYHYASQFVYSKAEKGKKIELPANSKPFSVVSPNGEKIPVVVRQPGINTAVARDDPLRDTVSWDSPVVLSPEDFEPIAKDGPHNGTTVWPSKNSSSTSRKSSASTTGTKEKSLRDDPSVSTGVTRGGKGGASVPIVPSDSVFSNALSQYGALTDNSGVLHRPRSRSPFTKPGLWEANPDNPHNRDHANKWYYRPESVNIDWLNGQLAWGGHWAVPAALVGGTAGFSAVHFPTVGNFLNIPDDYD